MFVVNLGEKKVISDFFFFKLNLNVYILLALGVDVLSLIDKKTTTALFNSPQLSILDILLTRRILSKGLK